MFLQRYHSSPQPEGYCSCGRPEEGIDILKHEQTDNLFFCLLLLMSSCVCFCVCVFFFFFFFFELLFGYILLTYVVILITVSLSAKRLFKQQKARRTRTIFSLLLAENNNINSNIRSRYYRPRYYSMKRMGRQDSCSWHLLQDQTSFACTSTVT